jgi:hypothetical protein
MNKSAWSIIVMGIILVSLLAMGMWMTLAMVQETPGSMRKLSGTLRDRFGFESVGATIRFDGARTLLSVVYETRADSRSNLSVQKAEMRNVAEFAIAKYDGSDKNDLDAIVVTRTETHGNGQSHVAHHTEPNPGKRRSAQ